MSLLDKIKTALVEGKVKFNLNEASAITGSGSNTGGRVIYDEAFAAMRFSNPLRTVARVITTIGSDEAFVAKTGNATLQTNPWGYPLVNNTGTPNIATTFWQLPIRDLNAAYPVRTAVLEDINGLEEILVSDLMAEFGQQEAAAMIQNNDQAGSTTPTTGGTNGVRGLNSYPNSLTAAAYGTNGTGITNGRHTILGVACGAALLTTYNDLANLIAALPPQYLYQPTTAWMMHPTTIQALREQLTVTATPGEGSPMFLEVGDDDGGAVVYIFGHRVIPNPYVSLNGTGTYPVYLAEWEKFFTIVDNLEMSIKRFDQTTPGSVVLFGEKRVACTVRDPFAGVRLVGIAPPAQQLEAPAEVKVTKKAK